MRMNNNTASATGSSLIPLPTMQCSLASAGLGDGHYSSLEGKRTGAWAM